MSDIRTTLRKIYRQAFYWKAKAEISATHDATIQAALEKHIAELEAEVQELLRQKAAAEWYPMQTADPIFYNTSGALEREQDDE